MYKVKTYKDIGGEKGSKGKHEPQPMKRMKQKGTSQDASETVNPCSGHYVGEENGLSVEMMVDVDKIREYSTELDVVSGTISAKAAGDGPWSSDAISIYFTVLARSLKYSGAGKDSRNITAKIKATFSDGEKAGGEMSVKLTHDSTGWKAQVELEIDDQPKLLFKSLQRKSLFFKDIKLNIDYTDKVIWPIVEVFNLGLKPSGMEKRKIDAFSAFEDAGLKLHYNESDNELVEDSYPQSGWTKSDIYNVMMQFFDEVVDSDIWCMMGTTPPDKRCMGFSFHRKGRHGFALFTGHSTFAGLDSDDATKKAEAQRRLVHYLVHECGRCLGLKHPFEIGAPNSMSWMNYAWKYDESHNAGSFYKNFKYSFSDQELMILRHSPGKEFIAASSSSSVLSSIMGGGYQIKSNIPDLKLADDDSDIDEEGESGAVAGKYSKPRSMRKVALDLKIQSEPFVKGQLLSFEARVKNLGKLPVLVEGDLSLESGNLQLYLTDPKGNVQVIDPSVRPIQSGYSRPLVLYTPEDEEGPDRYSELVIVGEGSDGYPFDVSGKYELRAVYAGGRYKVTSATYPITITDNDEEDDETNAQILKADTSQASSGGLFQGYWEKMVSKDLEGKKKHITALVGVMEDLYKDGAQQPVSSGKGMRGARGKKTLSAATPILTTKQLLNDTVDLLTYYKQQGKKGENHIYSKLVLTRYKLYSHANGVREADNEFNEMLADLVTRGVKYDVLKQLSRQRNKLKTPVNPEDKTTPEYLQKKVDAVLNWAPSTEANGEPDLSGIGLGNPFSNFDIDHIQAATKIVEMLFTKQEETNNLLAVISFADKLQKGREVNYMVLRWALEAFIVHSMDAKKAGIKYPEPRDMDHSNMINAMVVTRRDGLPSEDWMNYWRCDADFNYHHRHFHMVYRVRDFLIGKVFLSDMPSHLRRQGELFGYMHTQMLARYDAERESWGLQPVTPWSYEERAMSFNAGLEFHNDKQFSIYLPRPNIVWPHDDKIKAKSWEDAYHKAVLDGHLPDGGELTPNWACHVLEASSGLYKDTFGSLHNFGHDVIGKAGLPSDKQSYMYESATSVRDPIFFRWHKRIDNLWQENNDYYRVELADDGPPVTVTPNDIIIDSNAQPPQGFDQFNDGNWVNDAPEEVSHIKTYLGPPTKKYELDNKLTRDKFYYHLRIKRNKDAKAGNLNLTARIFICPKDKQAQRKKWIEMDKFVFSIASGSDHINLTRADHHSSVIKRNFKDMEDDFEQKFVKTTKGFCECGWPYTMLLPRGKKEGQEYVLVVIVTDNDIDSIGIRTTCGSMSFCGALDEEYPDARHMGYPFSNPITLNGVSSNIPEVFDEINNAAYKSFIIENDVSEPSPVNAVDIWWPYVQLKDNDGTLIKEPPNGVTEFIQCDLVGTFRVLIDTEDAWPSRGEKVLIRFQGRGGGGGSYAIRDVTLALRDGNTLNVIPNQVAKVTFEDQIKFSVPEQGLISDVVTLQFQPARGDYFVTFTLDSPGVYLPSSQHKNISTYFISSNRSVPQNWSHLDNLITGRFARIHCISGIMTALPSP